jgi:type IV pilus assembly protein PilN
MIQINLLPWRAAEKEARKVRFIATLAGFIGLSLFILVILHFYTDHSINRQLLRNSYLQSRLEQEQGKLFDLKKMKEQQAVFMTELYFIIKLREQSLQVIRLLDNLTKTIPNTVFLDKIMRQKNIITLTGEAESNLDITQFMKNLSQSHYFTAPVLNQITAKPNTLGMQDFELRIEQKMGVIAEPEVKVPPKKDNPT